VNARGTFLTIREMLRRRTQRPVPHGRIVNISSSAAQLGGYNGSSAYVASKGAVLSLTKVAAREAAPLGITVNAIAPGAIDTPLLREVMPPERDAAYLERVPAGRIGQPSDVAAAVAYLVSIEAGYVTGCCLDVNGGLRMQ
jgi:3-oxoacyl-[acyl-carrier protein] reductase